MLERLVTPWIVYFERCNAVGFTFFGCSFDVVTGYYQAKVDSAERSLLGALCIYFSFVRQSYFGQVTRIPPRGKKVPERTDVHTFYEQMR